MPISHGANDVNLVEANQVILIKPLLNPAQMGGEIIILFRIFQIASEQIRCVKSAFEVQLPLFQEQESRTPSHNFERD